MPLITIEILTPSALCARQVACRIRSRTAVIPITPCSRTPNIPVQVHVQDEPTSQQYRAVSSPKQPSPSLGCFIYPLPEAPVFRPRITHQNLWLFFFWWVGRGISAHPPFSTKQSVPWPSGPITQIEESGHHLKDGSSPTPSSLYWFVAPFSPLSGPQRHPSTSRTGMPVPQIRLLPHGHGAGEHRLVDHRPC